MANDDISGLLDPDQMGRGGGVVAMLVGAILLAASGYFTAVASSGSSIWLWPFGMLGGLLIFSVGVVGYRRGAQRVHAPSGMSLEALRSDVETRDLGFWVCTRCRVVMPRNLTGECLECGSGVDCLEVATDDDRRMALSAIPRP